MREMTRSHWGGIGIGLLVPAALVFTVSYVGCGSSPGDGPTGFTGTDSRGSIRVTLVNNCGDPMNVRMNTDTPWMSGGVPRCPAGQTCSVVPGTYPIDLGTRGINFFVGSSSVSATKAEITYQTELSFDISVITEAGGCPNSCTSSSCCSQAFNHPIQITTTPVSRCLSCDGLTCPDAFHFPTDNSKQVNATGATALTVEFCPVASCPATGWRTCTSTEVASCRNLSNQACVGELTVCCPPQPSAPTTHSCFCETGTYCGHAPNPYNACGMDASRYCYVPNP